jgi:hypothetical protein
MGMITEVLPDFDGFAVRYDQAKNPFFRPIVVENLRRLATVSAGKALLSEIAAARPRYRSAFPPSVNVLCIPTSVNLTQSGYKRETMVLENQTEETVLGMTPSNQAKYAIPGCPFWIAGGSSASAVVQAGTRGGTGTVAIMRFSNVQIITNLGEPADPYIVLAHELIHAMHMLYGIQIDGQDEERWTTGIGIFENNRLSENAFRRQFGLTLRTQYY